MASSSEDEVENFTSMLGRYQANLAERYGAIVREYNDRYNRDETSKRIYRITLQALEREPKRVSSQEEYDIEHKKLQKAEKNFLTIQERVLEGRQRLMLAANSQPVANINISSSSDEEENIGPIPWRMPRRLIGADMRPPLKLSRHNEPRPRDDHRQVPMQISSQRQQNSLPPMNVPPPPIPYCVPQNAFNAPQSQFGFIPGYQPVAYPQMVQQAPMMPFFPANMQFQPQFHPQNMANLQSSVPVPYSSPPLPYSGTVSSHGVLSPRFSPVYNDGASTSSGANPPRDSRTRDPRMSNQNQRHETQSFRSENESANDRRGNDGPRSYAEHRRMRINERSGPKHRQSRWESPKRKSPSEENPQQNNKQRRVEESREGDGNSRENSRNSDNISRNSRENSRYSRENSSENSGNSRLKSGKPQENLRSSENSGSSRGNSKENLTSRGHLGENSRGSAENPRSSLANRENSVENSVENPRNSMANLRNSVNTPGTSVENPRESENSLENSGLSKRKPQENRDSENSGSSSGNSKENSSLKPQNVQNSKKSSKESQELPNKSSKPPLTDLREIRPREDPRNLQKENSRENSKVPEENLSKYSNSTATSTANPETSNNARNSSSNENSPTSPEPSTNQPENPQNLQEIPDPIESQLKVLHFGQNSTSNSVESTNENSRKNSTSRKSSQETSTNGRILSEINLPSHQSEVTIPGFDLMSNTLIPPEAIKKEKEIEIDPSVTEFISNPALIVKKEIKEEVGNDDSTDSFVDSNADTEPEADDDNPLDGIDKDEDFFELTQGAGKDTLEEEEKEDAEEEKKSVIRCKNLLELIGNQDSLPSSPHSWQTYVTHSPGSPRYEKPDSPLQDDENWDLPAPETANFGQYFQTEDDEDIENFITPLIPLNPLKSPPRFED